MTERGTAPTGPRRPFEYAVVTKGPELRSLSYRAEVRIDEPVTRNDRDVILVWNYQSPTRFYYAHLSQDNTIYPHNGIFVVDDADRRRIDDQWNGTDLGAPPAIDDTDWHDVRLDYAAGSGRIAVYVDGSREPLMTATDTTFAGGRVGFGSFDNYGRVRDVFVVGVRANSSRPRTTSVPRPRGGAGPTGLPAATGSVLHKEVPTVAAVGREEVMRKSRWWMAAATGALAAALLAPIPSAQSSSGPAPAAAEGEPISDPIPEDPERSSLGLVLEEYHQFPKTEPHPGADRPPAHAARPDQLHR